MFKQLWPSFVGILIATPFVFIFDGFKLGLAVIAGSIVLVLTIYAIVKRVMR